MHTGAGRSAPGPPTVTFLQRDSSIGSNSKVAVVTVLAEVMVVIAAVMYITAAIPIITTDATFTPANSATAATRTVTPSQDLR